MGECGVELIQNMPSYMAAGTGTITILAKYGMMTNFRIPDLVMVHFGNSRFGPGPFWECLKKIFLERFYPFFVTFDKPRPPLCIDDKNNNDFAIQLRFSGHRSSLCKSSHFLL